jgi:predicted transcriptional regulator
MKIGESKKDEVVKKTVYEYNEFGIIEKVDDFKQKEVVIEYKDSVICDLLKNLI